MDSKPTLMVERLRELLDYDPLTGVFTWRSDLWRHKAGDVAGYPAGHGRRLQIWIDGSALYAHRLAWVYVYGVWPDGQVDHRNGDKLDNRLANLREATNAENKQNQSRAYANNTTGLLGVTPQSSGTWRARIMVDGKSRNLGSFSTPEAAHDAYLAAKREMHEFWAA